MIEAEDDRGADAIRWNTMEILAADLPHAHVARSRESWCAYNDAVPNGNRYRPTVAILNELAMRVTGSGSRATTYTG